MHRLFASCDLWLMRYKKRERIALFALPIVLCLGVALAVVLPPIDEIYAQSELAYTTQDNLAKELESSLERIETSFAHEEFASTLAYKQQLLQSLQEKAQTNTQLTKKLAPFSKSPTPKGTHLHFNAIGDVDMLEDIIELLEAQHFIFIENLAIKAPFASSLEMSFDVLNFGETLKRFKGA